MLQGRETSTPSSKRAYCCCGGYRSAISHNICFFGGMFVFVTFAATYCTPRREKAQAK